MAFKDYFNLLKEAGSEFNNDNATKLAASLAYSTIFSIGPMLLLIITLTGVFYHRSDMTMTIYDQIKQLVGKQGADQLLSILDQVERQQHKTLFGIIGGVILVFGATSVFIEIQGSINYIWSLRAKPKKGWLKFLTNRLLSFSLIVSMGFLLIVSLIINSLMDLLNEQLQHLFGQIALVFNVLNVAVIFVIITALFAIIYKVLPDGKIHWKDAFIGASFTGLLFLIGKFLISLYLGKSSVGNTYGAAASIIILLTWVYYNSLILYFGAEFTKVYALRKGMGITPSDTAVFILKNEAKELPNNAEHPLQ